MVERANSLSQRPYEAYTGERVAGFTDFTNRAFDRIGGQQVAGQIGTATDMATQAGQAALGVGAYNPFEMGGFDAETAQQYMNPYIQNVLDVRTREARRNADIEAQNRAAAFTRSNAFGGGRQAIMDAEASRNTAQQLDDIQATGLQQAFETGRNQYVTEAQLREQSRQFGADLGLRGNAQALAAANTLGDLGQTQFGQEMAITEGLGTAGQLQQQQRQNELDVAYQDFRAAQQYPYEQISWLQGIVSGAPHSTTSTTHSRTSGVTTPGVQTTNQTQQVAQPAEPNRTSQYLGAATAAAGAGLEAWESAGSAQGGVIGYADGGITGLMSDQQLQERAQNPNLPTIARLAAEMRAQENAQMRKEAQMSMATRPTGPTVAEEAAAGLAALPVGEFGRYAGGGVLSYADGGETDDEEYENFYQQAYRQGEEKGSIYDGMLPEREEPREIVLPKGTEQMEYEQIRMANPDANVSVEGSGDRLSSMLKGVGRALTKSDDVDAYRARQSDAETARLARQTPQGITALMVEPPAAPPPRAPSVAQAPVPPATPTATPTARSTMTAPGGVPAAVQPAAPRPQAQGLMATPEAQAVAPKPAQGGFSQGLLNTLEAQRAQAAKSEAELIRLAQEEADAKTAEAKADRDALEAEKGKVDEADKEKRERIGEREKELDKQKKSAFNYALIRAGLAMMSGTSPYAMVNIGRGLNAGLEGYTADMQAIDKAREGLRAQLDELAELRAQQAAATGKQAAALNKAVREAERNAKFGVKKLALESGIKASNSQVDMISKALMDQGLREEYAQNQQGREMDAIAARGSEARRTQAARPPGAGRQPAGQVTDAMLFRARLDARKEWQKAMANPVDRLRMEKAYGKGETGFQTYLQEQLGSAMPAAQDEWGDPEAVD